MDLTTAARIVAEAERKRQENPRYWPTQAELKACDFLMIAQARQRLAQEARRNTAA